MVRSPLSRAALLALLSAALLLAPGPARGQPDPGGAAARIADAGGRPADPGSDHEVELMSDEERTRLAKGSPDQSAGGPIRQDLALVQSGSLAWTFLGPRPILRDFWSGSTDASGRVTSIVVDPRNTNVVYISAAQGGVWKSVDAGITWTPLTDQLSSLASGALALDPVNADIVYYGTGEQHYSGDSFYGDGLFRSTDAGATWSKIALKADVGSYISRIAIKPTNPSLIFVARDSGLVRSLDGGGTWTRVLWGGDCNDLAIVPSSPATVYAAIRGVGLFKSTNDGGSWTALGGGLPTTGFLRINFGLSRSNPLVLYASFVSTDGSLLGMYRTADGGTTWTKLIKTPNYLGAQGWYDNTVAVDPTNPNICIAGGVYPYDNLHNGLIRTTNSGTKWTDVTFGRHGGTVHPDQHLVYYGPDGTVWVCHDGGVSRSLNPGDSWTNCNHDLELTQLYQLGLHPTSSTFLLGGSQDNGGERYTGTLDWLEINAGDGGPSGVEWDSPNIYYSTSQNFYPVYKWDNTALVAQIIGPWVNVDPSSAERGPMVIDPNVPNTVLIGTNRVWKSGDSGGSWTAVSPDLTLGGGVLFALAVASGNSNVMYAGSNNGKVFVTSNGTSWTEHDAGLPAAAITDLILDPADSQHAFSSADVSQGDRVFTTADGGATWTSLTGDLPAGLRGLSLAIDFQAAPPRLHLGTDYGLYASSDGGAHWTKDSAGLPNCAVYDLRVDPVNALIVAGTHGRGSWSSALARGAVVARVARAASAPGVATSSLEPIAPSPSRTPVTIAFTLARPARASVRVYDVSGRMRRVLDEGERSAGVHRLTWDGNDSAGRAVGAGVYFARLDVEGASFTRRLVLLPTR
jgi:photosystem II stability/assembly factor-like uncharacterized protein